MSSEKLSLESIVDGSPLGRSQIVVIAICALVALVDGFDTQSIALVAPVIASTWHIEPAKFGLVFGAGLSGSLIGALVFGVCGDRFGRKPALIAAVTLFALVTLITPFADSLATLAIIRLVTGLGLGGALPGAISLTSEYVPQKMRATLVSVMFCGFPLGAVIGGLVSVVIIPALGWPSVFYVGGLIPLLLLPAMVKLLPESVRFLAIKRDGAGVVRIMTRMGWFQSWDCNLNSGAPVERSPVTSLFRDGRAAGTVLLWVTLFLSLLLTYFLVNWIPILARKSGVGMTAAVLAVSTLNLGAIFGCLAIGRIADRRRRVTAVIATGFVLGAVAIALIGASNQSIAALLIATFMAGVLSLGAQMCTVVYCASFYETSLRATGVGWAIGVGRIGSIVGPVLGGMLIAAGVAIPPLFIAVGVMSLGSAAAIFTLGRLGAGQAVSVPRVSEIT